MILIAGLVTLNYAVLEHKTARITIQRPRLTG